MKNSIAANQVDHDDQAFVSELIEAGDLDNTIPKLARDQKAIRRIEAVIRGRQTSHELILGDSRAASALVKESIHLVVTSPPYWTLKRYNEHDNQMGHVVDYDEFKGRRRESRQFGLLIRGEVASRSHQAPLVTASRSELRCCLNRTRPITNKCGCED